MMYEELVKDLRYLAKVYSICENENTKEYNLAVKAADAIEEMQRCIDGIDADNDSLCEQLQKSEADNINLTGWLAEEHAKHQWISVEERLPEENGEYLVVYTLKAIPPIPRVEICSFAKNLRNVNKYDLPKNKPGFYQSDSEYGYYEITGVSHWMPLPELPEKLPEESEP